MRLRYSQSILNKRQSKSPEKLGVNVRVDTAVPLDLEKPSDLKNDVGFYRS